MHANLSLEQAPPISVPFRFFLTAPLFGVAAGLLLAWQGSAGFASRWSPEVLALTHLLSVGFLLQVMCGALLQFVPVAAGGNVWHSRLVAGVVHPLILLAALALVAAFVWNWRIMFQVAAPLFIGGLGSFIIAVGVALLRTPAQGMSIQVLRLALFGLAVTLTLGVLLTTVLGWHAELQTGWSLLNLVNAHVAWGLGGWALLLVIGVSYLVVPMFQLTPAYPIRLSRLLPLGLFVVLGVWSILLIAVEGTPRLWLNGLALAGMLLAALYAGVTLRLQVQRRRRVTDTTFSFWRGAMLALLALAISWLVFLLLPELGEHPRAALWLGVLALGGVFVSVAQGMLYKIVPFLIWLHLQRLGNLKLKVLPPNIKQMIPEKAMRGQLKLHFTGVGLMLAAVLWPPLSSVAGLVFAASFAWQEWNLIGAVRIYVDFKKRTLKDQIRADAAHHAP